MLQEAAYNYVTLSEEALKSISYGLFFLGAAIAGYFHQSNRATHRGMYVFWLGLIFLLVNLGQVVWLSSPAAIAGGYLWVFLYVDITSRMVAGYATTVVAKARSRDAFGNARSAILAFIPLLNLWLLFAPSANKAHEGRGAAMLRGIAAFAAGCILFAIAFALLEAINKQSDNIANEFTTNEGARTASVDLTVRTTGIEETLRGLTTQTRQKIDDVTTLLRTEADGKVLQYVYELSSSASEIPYSFGGTLIKKNCNDSTMATLLKNGATIKYKYLKPDGSEIGTVIVTRQLCGF